MVLYGIMIAIISKQTSIDSCASLLIPNTSLRGPILVSICFYIPTFLSRTIWHTYLKYFIMDKICFAEDLPFKRNKPISDNWMLCAFWRDSLLTPLATHAYLHRCQSARATISWYLLANVASIGHNSWASKFKTIPSKVCISFAAWHRFCNL